jgi:hypothetical protein
MENNQLIALVTAIVGYYAQPWFGEEFFADHDRGRLLTRELLCGHARRFFDTTRMKLETFGSLTHWLQVNTQLSSSRYIELEEKVIIFL